MQGLRFMRFGNRRKINVIAYVDTKSDVIDMKSTRYICSYIE